MRFKSPRDCAAVSHGGVILAIDADGSIEASEDAAIHLAAHGIMPWDGHEDPVRLKDRAVSPAVIRRMPRSALVAALEAFGVSGTTAKTLAELRKMLGDAIAAQDS